MNGAARSSRTSPFGSATTSSGSSRSWTPRTGRFVESRRLFAATMACRAYILFEDETELQNGVAILASEMGCSNKMKCRLLDEISAVRKAVADEPERQARRLAAAKRRVARMKQRAAAEQRQQ